MIPSFPTISPARAPAWLAATTAIGIACIQASGAEASSDAENILASADFSGLKANATLPESWHTSDGQQGISVRVVKLDREPETWVEMRDNGASAPANLRQMFKPVERGRLSLRLLTASDHSEGIGIYLGSGPAAAPTDRVIDVKTDDSGRIRLGSRARRRETPLVVHPDSVTRLWISWRPADFGTLDLRLGTTDAIGNDTEVAQFSAPDPAPITALRVTTDIPTVGGHFYVTDLVLTEL